MIFLQICFLVYIAEHLLSLRALSAELYVVLTEMLKQHKKQHPICHASITSSTFDWLHQSLSRILWISTQVRLILKWCNKVNQMSGQSDSCKHQCLWFEHQTDSSELLHAGSEQQIRGDQNILHIFHNSHNRYGSLKWRQSSRLQWPPYNCVLLFSAPGACVGSVKTTIYQSLVRNWLSDKLITPRASTH